ncbi:MAG: hypothetical protein QF594_06200 [Dehalococcoidales bacterium]|nr:hypothetical protein [Dehalococcoidales bacterium]
MNSPLTENSVIAVGSIPPIDAAARINGYVRGHGTAEALSVEIR